MSWIAQRDVDLGRDARRRPVSRIDPGARPDTLAIMTAASVRESVAAFNGNVTWEYSQGDWATLKIIMTNSVSRWGICKSLSAQWIVDHAYGGSLVNRVMGANGKINESAIKKIKADFIEVTGPGKSQAALTADWLMRRGILRRAKSLTYSLDRPRTVNGQVVSFVGRTSERGDMGTTPKDNAATPNEIASALRAIWQREKRVRLGGSYCQIDFAGSGSMGHAVAAWIGQDALFFDPNNGEYWFEDPAQFVAWFPTYYKKAGYTSWPVKFLRHWGVEEYALAARWKSASAR